MSELSLEKEETKLEKYLRREGHAEFVDAMRGANPAQLDFKLLDLAKHKEVIQDTKEGDDELKEAKEVAKALGAPYRDQLRVNAKMARFIGMLRKEQGLK